MPFITWNKSYSVGIMEFDKQHAMLVDLINAFHESLSKGEAKQNMVVLFSGLKFYTLKHFADEEKAMLEFNYPDYESHKKEHDDFIAQISDIEEKYKSRQIALSFEILQTLKTWLIKHVLGTDREYTQFFLDKGLM